MRGIRPSLIGGLTTLADEGNGCRQRVFALGQVFAAQLPVKASQMMKLGAMARVEEMASAS